MTKEEKWLLLAAALVWLIAGDRWKRFMGMATVQEVAIAGDPTRGNKTQSMG